jgi:hypothetical protein
MSGPTLFTIAWTESNNAPVAIALSDDGFEACVYLEGTPVFVNREANGGKRTVWVIIPVLGGYIVVKINTEKNRPQWSYEARRVPGKLGNSAAVITYEMVVTL